MKMLITVFVCLLTFVSCNNRGDELVNAGGGGGSGGSNCGFGILTVYNNSWNNYEVLIDSVFVFVVELKSSNGGTIPLGEHNVKVGVPQNYVLDTTFYVNDCIAYVLWGE
jgi:hypothetical protein